MQAVDAPSSQEATAEIYGEYIARILADEDSRRSSIEQRGLAVITTAGALTTVLFGIAALIQPSSNHGIPHSAHGPLGLAMIILIAAGVCGLLTNFPLGYHKITTEQAETIVKTDLFRKDAPTDARQRIAVTYVKELRSARRNTRLKAGLLFAAMSLELAGLGVLGWTVLDVIKARS